jgi:DNA-binding NarL/FixJ family response regulator
MITVVVADDHKLVRAGLVSLLSSTDDISVVGEAGDGAQAVDVVARACPNVVLMDLSMPVLDGVAATRQIAAECPDTRVLVLTSFSDRQRVNDALRAGAIGYLLKDCTPEELLAGVRAAAAGQVPLDPRVAGVLLPSQASEDAQLSEREKQVLRLAAEGLANKQIGRRLGISDSTVKVHLANVYRRIGVTDRTSAALWARDNLDDAERFSE